MPSDPQTWTDLKTAIANALNRDDLTTEIPQFIAWAERHFNRELWADARQDYVSASVSTEALALPSDFERVRAIYLDDAPRISLIQVTLDDLRDFYSASDTGRPTHYAISGGTLYLGPIPSQSYTLKMHYIQSVPALSDSQTTNWLLTAHSDLYRAGSLHEAFSFTKDEERASYWAQKRDQIIDSINRAAAKEQNGGPLSRRFGVPQVSNYFSH